MPYRSLTRCFDEVQVLGFAWGLKLLQLEETPLWSILIREVDVNHGLKGQDPVEFPQRLRPSATQRVDESRRIERLPELFVMGQSPHGVLPVGRQILRRAAIGLRTFHPALSPCTSDPSAASRAHKVRSNAG